MMATSNPYSSYMHSSSNHHYAWHGHNNHVPFRSGAHTMDHSVSMNTSAPSSYGVAPAATSGPSTSAQNAAAMSGKKRKRLQRACVACHKAKRRCDGGLPCSNCDFSGRSCAYSDAQGKAVPPTKRTLRPSEAAQREQEQQQRGPHQQPQSHLQQQSASNTSPHAREFSSSHGLPSYTYSGPQASSTRSLSLSPPMEEMATLTQRVPKTVASPRPGTEPSPDTRRELLMIFFSQIHPWSSLLDEVDFLRDLSSSAVSPISLCAIYALSSHHAYQQRTRSHRYHRLVDEVGDGTVYAREARRLLYAEDSMSGACALDGALTLETAQALCLLACFEFDTGNLDRAASYIQLSARYVANSSQNSRSDRDRHADASNIRSKQKLGHRLTCLVAVLDVCIATACSRSSALRPWDLEMALDAITQSSSSPRRDRYDDPTTQAFVQLLTVTAVLSGALDVHRRSKLSHSRAGSIISSQDAERQAHSCEKYLQDWSDALDNTSRFDENNLYNAQQTLSHGDGGVQGGSQQNLHSVPLALTWCTMHMLAEAATLLLRDATGAELPHVAAQNLAMILERMNVGAFSGPLVALGVIVLRSSSRASEASAFQHDDGQRSGEMSNSYKLRVWAQLRRTSDLLQSDARLDATAMSQASFWLNLGRKSFQHDGEGRPMLRPARPSWTTSPRQPSSAYNAQPATGSESMQFSNSSTKLNRPRDGSLGTTAASPRQSIESLDATQPPTLLKSSRSGSSSTVGSNSSATTQTQQLPPLSLFSGSSATMYSSGASRREAGVSPATTLPPLRFPSPDEMASRAQGGGKDSKSLSAMQFGSPNSNFNQQRA